MSKAKSKTNKTEPFETFPWMETECRNVETSTFYDKPHENPRFNELLDSDAFYRSRGANMIPVSQVPDNCKKCFFYYLPGKLFGKKINPK